MRQQLRSSHKHSKLFKLHVFLKRVVSFQITKPGNIESIYCQKIFMGILNHENILHEKFITQKFQIYDMNPALMKAQ